MASVVRDKKMQVSKAALLQAITDFENYPKFLPEVVGAKVASGSTATKKRVKFELEVVKRFEYLLEFNLSKEDCVEWKLVESNFFKTNSGKWELKALKDKETQVHYELEVGFGFLVPGWVTKKLTEVNLPKMFESFETRAQSLEKGV